MKAAAVVRLDLLLDVHVSDISLQVQHVRSDPHSPSRYRVDGTVYNIPEFAEAFRCSSQAKVGNRFMRVYGWCRR